MHWLFLLAPPYFFNSYRNYGELGSDAAKKGLLQMAKALKKELPAGNYRRSGSWGGARSGKMGVANNRKAKKCGSKAAAELMCIFGFRGRSNSARPI
jgi:hypothetical protein